MSAKCGGEAGLHTGKRDQTNRHFFNAGWWWWQLAYQLPLYEARGTRANKVAEAGRNTENLTDIKRPRDLEAG